MAEAVKNDQGKTMMGLLPPDALEETAKVFTYGAKKYSPYNWAAGSGFSYSRLYDALQRHLNAFWSGEDFDEVGNYHLACACCNVMMLLSTYLRGIGADDRPDIRKRKDAPVREENDHDRQDEHDDKPLTTGRVELLVDSDDNRKIAVGVDIEHDNKYYKYRFLTANGKEIVIVAYEAMYKKELLQFVGYVRTIDNPPSHTLVCTNDHARKSVIFWISDDSIGSIY